MEGKYMSETWVKEVPFAVTVTDKTGNIIEMNNLSRDTFEKYGGKALIGKNLEEVHSEHACKKIAEMISSKSANSYTIEKNGVKKLIYQTPWYQDGEYAGLVELSMIIPLEMPHYVRT
jgi:transcriptional regulator with PAS, ATPase and Fis domain